ncbi:uncharacterized protein PHALS_05070 [Plasmopara halstedii]|uniref:RxLR-like protein n=1 Tax=Plasmopara halstedii TaxID=4781 RepID=A0A0P1AAN9_PLAHL|nr:uncharacterized protein PHALS_05070 [Plasmopara halstedii]CEG37479.1 hypothetical protein PHALS_05070 [Plasmopara halstedii]|eukprot:XP_024573848.1 hypothetical protein PHALS_05070 [Plasmopara halstedii]
MLIAGSILLLVCPTSAYNSTRSTSLHQTAVGVPLDGILVANSTFLAQSLPRFRETTNKKVEERANGGLFGKMSDSIKSLVKGRVPAEYKTYVESLKQYEDLESVLMSSDMKKLNDFCREYNGNERNPKILSSVKETLMRFDDKETYQKLREVALRKDGNQRLMSHLALDHIINLVKIKKKSPIEFFEFLEFGGDLAEAVRNGKFGELYFYIEVYNRFNKKPLRNYHDLLKILTAHFDGEGNLVHQFNELNELNELTHHRAYEHIIWNLKWTLFSEWKKLPLDLVWSRLQFGPNAYDALTSGKLEMFYEFIAKFHPNRKYLAIGKFMSTYKEVDVTEALENARMQPLSKDFASKMHHERLDYWDANEYTLKEFFGLLNFNNVDSANSALFKLENLSNFIWSSFDKSKMKARLQDLAKQVSVALKDNNRLAFNSPAADLDGVLYKLWTGDRISPEKLFSKLSIENAHIDTDGNVHLRANEVDFDDDFSAIPFNIPRRS